jgi:hypothetical protein
MKKIFYFASMMLALFMTTSCSIMNDNPVTPPTPEKTTTTITLDGTDYEADVVATFKGEIGQEVSLTLGVYDDFDIYGVDFGDGNILTDTVCYQNGGLRDAEGMTRTDTKHTKATVFTGTVAGEGNITVYGVNKSDIWYLNCYGNAIPTSFDQEKLKNVVQATFSGANVESVELPAMDKLTQFNFNNSPVKTLDVSKATALTSLSVDNTTQSQYAPQLESIDLSKNTELTYLKIAGNTTNKGKLAAIDLSNNTKLANVYLQDNAIKTAVMPAGAALTFLNLQNNELETIDLSVCASNKDVYLDNNKLKSATLGTITKSCKLENNALTLATMPAQPAGLSSSSKTKKFTYAPQAALVVNENVTELDLTSQLTVAKGELGKDGSYSTWYENVETSYSFVTAGGATLVEGTDYQVVEPGKFQFLKSQTEKVHAVMSNAAFPKFTGASAFVTTEFNVTVLK